MLVAVGTLYLVLPWLSSADALREWAERNATAASGFDVALGELHLGYDLGLHLADIKVAETETEPFLTVERVTVRLSPTGLFAGQPVAVGLVSPRLDADRLPRAQAAGAPTQLVLPFRTLDIEDGYILAGAAGEPIGPITVTVDALQAAAQDVQLFLNVDPALPPMTAAAAVVTGDGGFEFPTAVTWSGVPLGTLAERFGFGDSEALAGVLDLSAEVSGALGKLSGSGSLQVRELRYRADGLEVSGAIDGPFTVKEDRVVFDEPGLRVNNIAWKAGGLTGSTPAAIFIGSVALADGGARAVGTLSVDPLKASDETSTRVVEGLALTGKLDGFFGAASRPVVKLSVSAKTGEVLWDRFYAEVARYPTTVAATITIDERMRFALSDIDAHVGNLAVRGAARLSSTAVPEVADLRIDVDDIERLYALAVRDPFQESHPFLAEMAVGGSLDAHVVYERRDAEFSLTGELRLRDASLAANDPAASVRAVRLDLPLRFGAGNGDARESGELRIGSLRWGETVIEDVSAPLTVRDNSIGLAAPVAVPLFGGSLEIGEFTVSEILAPQPRASLAVAVVELDLAALSAAAGLPPLRGTISGSIPKITALGSEVRSEGEIRIAVFEGSIAVRNLSIDRAFSPLPAFGLDLEFEDISLHRVTETLEIGRISGIVRGAANNLVIVDNQPLSFDAWMETVERSGVSQRVSVSAIQQLSILGGSGGDPLSQGILSFFDEYRYAKMGFKCRLENDRFELHGVETIDGKEYLVVGSRLPPSVNVVSHTQVISFPDMVRRLQRVTTAAAREDEKGEER